MVEMRKAINKEFANNLFLKTPCRTMALLVYALSKNILRDSFKAQNVFIPNQV